MELGSMMGDMRTLLHAEFAALLDRADVSQAAFARRVGVTLREVSSWVRGRAAGQRWVALLAIVLEDTMVEALLSMLNDAQLSYHQVLGVPYGADMAAICRAMRGLALLYHPDTGGWPEQMIIVTSLMRKLRSSHHKRPIRSG